MQASGDKLHALAEKCAEIAQWRLVSMNKDECTAAKRVVKSFKITGDGVGDKNDDATP